MEGEDGPILSTKVQSDMLALAEKAGDEAEDFILRLAENPFSPAIFMETVDEGGGLYSYRLPSGCVVFWQVISQPPFTRPRLGLMHRETVKIVGVKLDPL
jgi:hypothetical protein